VSQKTRTENAAFVADAASFDAPFTSEERTNSMATYVTIFPYRSLSTANLFDGISAEYLLADRGYDNNEIIVKWR